MVPTYRPQLCPVLGPFCFEAKGLRSGRLIADQRSIGFAQIAAISLKRKVAFSGACCWAYPVRPYGQQSYSRAPLNQRGRKRQSHQQKGGRRKDHGHKRVWIVHAAQRPSWLLVSAKPHRQLRRPLLQCFEARTTPARRSMKFLTQRSSFAIASNRNVVRSSAVSGTNGGAIFS